MTDRNRGGNGQVAAEAHANVDHDGPGGPSASVLASGHEPDVMTDRPIWYAFAFLIAGAVLVFGVIVPSIFSASPFRPQEPGASGNLPLGLPSNEGPVRGRLERLAGPQGYQPRLDGLDVPRAEAPSRLADDRGRASIRSFIEEPNEPGKAMINSPDYHAENFWPDRYPGYFKDGTDRARITDAYKLLQQGGGLKARDGAKSMPATESAGRPKESSGGQPPKVEAHTDHKEHKEPH
jgi:hypothetical protein